ncbi:MAG: hypothetical protein WD184_04230 [Acidimicrobiia bacterium]
MELLGVFLILAAALIGGGWAMYEYMTYTQPERERALRDELEALQAAQRLSIAAWQARQYMAGVVRGDVIDEA